LRIKENETHLTLQKHDDDKTLISNSLYEFDNWGKNLSHRKMQYNYSKTMFTERAKPIWRIGEPDNQRPDK
jgi:hypothetical protein